MPPHFHFEGRDFRAMVVIRTTVGRAGNVRNAPDAREWAQANVGLLRPEWARLKRRLDAQ
jgi:hypothetical protein